VYTNEYGMIFSVYNCIQFFYNNITKTMNETKILSTRIPFEHYIDVIRRAQKCNLSVSDYLIFLLFEDIEKQASVQSLTAQNKLLEQQLKSAIQEIQQKSVEIERLNNELIKVVPLAKPLPITKSVTVKEKSTANTKKKRPVKAKQASAKETITST
jgi:uncharacterized protein YwgA